MVVTNTNVLDLMAASDPSLKLSQYDLAGTESVRGTYRYEVSSQATEVFKPGDLFVYSIGGGGGYGDVLEREPEAVMDDLRTNVISHQVARGVYRVVYDEATLLVDPPATARQRDAARAERKARGKPFAEFMADWRQLRPSADKLKYYGDWPEPHAPGYDRPFWGMFD